MHAPLKSNTNHASQTASHTAKIKQATLHTPISTAIPPPMQASYAIPSIFPMQMHLRRKADRMFARQTDPNAKVVAGELRRGISREQEAKRMHPFDARASGYVRSVMCVFENRAKFERVCVEGVSSSVT